MNFAASFNGGELFEPEGYLTDYYTDEAVKVIEANKDRPFLVALATALEAAGIAVLRFSFAGNGNSGVSG